MSSEEYYYDIHQFSPLTQSCLAWSEDGELAIAGKEHVAIMGASMGPCKDKEPKCLV